MSVIINIPDSFKMTDPNQEFDINAKNNPDNLSDESIDFALLRLDGFNSACKTCSAATNPTLYHPSCSSCGCSGFSIPSAANISPSCNKRRSPNSTAPISDQIPKRPKKLFLEPYESTATAAIPIPPVGDFSKITVPYYLPAFSAFAVDPSAQNAIPNSNCFPLIRCHSDPYHPPVKSTAVASNSPQSPPEGVKIAETTSLATPGSKATASLPPRPPFRRCFSDVSPVKSFSRSGSNNDISFDGNSEYQLLKKMKDCTKEMTQWFADVLPDETAADEEEDKGITIEENATDVTQANLVTESDEHVYAERTGDSLIIHFKCPCSRGFQILLSGTHCYYKLL